MQEMRCRIQSSEIDCEQETSERVTEIFQTMAFNAKENTGNYNSGSL